MVWAALCCCAGAGLDTHGCVFCGNCCRDCEGELPTPPVLSRSSFFPFTGHSSTAHFCFPLVTGFNRTHSHCADPCAAGHSLRLTQPFTQSFPLSAARHSVCDHYRHRHTSTRSGLHSAQHFHCHCALCRCHCTATARLAGGARASAHPIGCIRSRLCCCCSQLCCCHHLYSRSGVSRSPCINSNSTGYCRSNSRCSPRPRPCPHLNASPSRSRSACSACSACSAHPTPSSASHFLRIILSITFLCTLSLCIVVVALRFCVCS
jgi:hypothetical protein